MLRVAITPALFRDITWRQWLMSLLLTSNIFFSAVITANIERIA
ncbi:UNVERIFIED_ORG: hypothetical protein GGD51_000750 [Rhizobium esperanzae]